MDLNRWDNSNDLMLSMMSKTKNGKQICNGRNEHQEQLKEMSDMDNDYKWFILTGLRGRKNLIHLREKERQLIVLARRVR